jgi:hypothetical protein
MLQKSYEIVTARARTADRANQRSPAALAQVSCS